MIALRGRRVSAGLVIALAGVVLLVPGVSPARADTLYVNAGHDLQAALNAAKPGDEIVLQAGVRFVGEFRLPAKPAGPVITLRSSATLPNRRVTPADASLMPLLASGVVAPALDATNAANWRIDGVRFESTSNGEGEIIVLQDSTNITLDRVLIVAGLNGQKRAVRGNGRQISLTRSHIANIWREGQETHAFAAWDGAGPYTVTDNYLEAASISILFGGANSKSADRVPADILVEGNHMSKRLEWKGKPRVVKNLFELKSAKRAVVRNNLFERNWSDGQNGYAILFTVRNDEGGAPWSVVEDVLFERNIVRDTEHGINILGYDGYQPSGRATRITIRHNLILATGTFMQVGSEVGTLVVDHNTVSQGGTFLSLYYGDVWVANTSGRRAAQFAVESLQMTNTLCHHGAYGVYGEGAGLGTPALLQLTRAYTWTHNVLAGEQGWGQTYPIQTWQPAMADHYAQFNSDYTLAAGSWYRNAGNDGQDLGFLSSGVVSPAPLPAPDPEPLPAPDPEPLLPPPSTVSPADTTPPTVTFRLITQNPNTYKFRVDASDPSGIALVRIWFNGQLIKTATTVPVDADAPLRGLSAGTYPLVIKVTDGAGNEATLNRTVTK